MLLVFETQIYSITYFYHQWIFNTISHLVLKDEKELLLFLLVPKDYLLSKILFRFQVTLVQNI